MNRGRLRGNSVAIKTGIQKMIIKLVKTGGVELNIQCDSVMSQPLANYGLDLEVVTAQKTIRFVLRHTPTSDEWQRAYLVENGKTVDKFQPSVPPQPN